MRLLRGAAGESPLTCSRCRPRRPNTPFTLSRYSEHPADSVWKTIVAVLFPFTGNHQSQPQRTGDVASHPNWVRPRPASLPATAVFLRASPVQPVADQYGNAVVFCRVHDPPLHLGSARAALPKTPTGSASGLPHSPVSGLESARNPLGICPEPAWNRHPRGPAVPRTVGDPAAQPPGSVPQSGAFLERSSELHLISRLDHPRRPSLACASGHLRDRRTPPFRIVFAHACLGSLERPAQTGPNLFWAPLSCRPPQKRML